MAMRAIAQIEVSSTDGEDSIFRGRDACQRLLAKPSYDRGSIGGMVVVCCCMFNGIVHYSVCSCLIYIKPCNM